MPKKSNKRGPSGPSFHSCQIYPIGIKTTETMIILILCLIVLNAAANSLDNSYEELLVEGIFFLFGEGVSVAHKLPARHAYCCSLVLGHT